MSTKDGCKSDDEAREVSFTTTVKIRVGYHQCGVCKAWTPPPTTEQLLAFARAGHDSTVWPGDRDRSGEFMPAGWSIDTVRYLVCPACTEAKERAFRERAGAHGNGKTLAAALDEVLIAYSAPRAWTRVELLAELVKAVESR